MLHEHLTSLEYNDNDSQYYRRRKSIGKMRKTRIPLRAASLLVSSMMASASTIPLTHLFERGSSSQCPLPNFDQCPQPANQPNWPDNFCCQKGSSCIYLAGNTTLLCCPPGSSCDFITTTACQMDFFNADLHPDSMIKTTALNGAMGHCGEGTCCPFGYHCDADGNGGPICVRDDNQNAVPFTTTPAKPSTTASRSTVSTTTTARTTTTLSSSVQVIPTSPPATTPTPLPGQNNGASSGADTSSPPSETAQPAGSGGTPAAVIAGASVGAALLVLAGAFVAFVFLRRRHRKRQEEGEEAEKALRLTRSTSSFGNIISNPIVAENTTMRSDFVLGKSSPGGGDRGSAGFDRASTLVDDDHNASPQPQQPSPVRMREGVGTTARVPPIRNMAAQAPRQSSIAYGIPPDTTSSPYYQAAARGDQDQDRSGPPRLVLPYPETPRQGGQEREPSSISINVFADPRIATPQRGGDAGLETPDMRRTSRMTTFSDMLRSADLGGVARGEPYVPPGSQQGTPASRRR